MTDRELFEITLDALEEINKLSVGENAICLPAEIDTAMDALRERLAQPEQEPVAWICEGSASDEKHDIDYWQEDIDAIPIGTQLYTTPPQRQWVGLTDEEIDDAARYCVKSGQSVNAAIRGIEAKLKEKNT
jgi:hypothetical protein